MNIHSLMNQFAKFDFALVGKGPKNPECSVPDLQKEIENFLSQYSFLQKDQDYVDFLKYYAGAMLDLPDGSLIVDIFGFNENISMHLTRDESPVIDRHGYYTFCNSIVEKESNKSITDNFLSMGYSFDATDTKKWGVYRIVGNGEHEWYCSDFISWLEILVESRGYLPTE